MSDLDVRFRALAVSILGNLGRDATLERPLSPIFNATRGELVGAAGGPQTAVVRISPPIGLEQLRDVGNTVEGADAIVYMPDQGKPWEPEIGHSLTVGVQKWDILKTEAIEGPEQTVLWLLVLGK